MLGIRQKKTWLSPLREFELFDGCTADELAHVDRLMTEVKVPAGTHLTDEGNRGMEFFVIREGKAMVSRGDDELNELPAGAFFGELALLDRTPRTATVSAASDMRVWVLYRPEFSELMDVAPIVAERIRKAAEERRSRMHHPSGQGRMILRRAEPLQNLN
jgi:CRP/FNR family transcriptional regulator, cyclic AMP receptor protein